MGKFLVIGLIGVLLGIAIEDIKYRSVRWWLFALIGFGFIGVEYTRFSIVDTGLNIGFVSVQVLLLFTYFSIKEKRVVNITTNYLGMGDIVFWLAACFLFSLPNYIVFFISSLMFAALVYGIMKLSNMHKQTTIPLAGLQSIVVGMMLLLNLISKDWSFRDSAWIEKLVIV